MDKSSVIPPLPTWGRVGVGEASDDCLAPKRGFPLSNLPQVGAGLSHVAWEVLAAVPEAGEG
jgi:hypothetical protein